MDESPAVPKQHHLKPKRPRRKPSAQVNDSRRDSSPAQPTGSTTHEPTPFGNPGDQESNRKPADSHQAQTLANPSNKTQRTNRRTGPRFNAHLTDAPKEKHPKERVDSETSDNIPDLKDDLTTRLIRELSTRPYPDCAICFNSIHPTQPTWSCSPSYAIAGSDPESSNVINENAQCCWTTFHLKCIHSWASKTVKGVTEALRARGEERECEWLCPACRAKRLSIPSGYRSVMYPCASYMRLIYPIKMFLWIHGRSQTASLQDSTFLQ
jgi:transcriptional repressor NF-X1